MFCAAFKCTIKIKQNIMFVYAIFLDSSSLLGWGWVGLIRVAHMLGPALAAASTVEWNLFCFVVVFFVFFNLKTSTYFL